MSHEPEARGPESPELDVAGDDVEGGSRVAASRAAVVAEVTDVGGLVLVGGAAAHAVLGVRRVLKRRPSMTGIVDAEPKNALASHREVTDDRIVRVDDEGGVLGQGGDGRPPALGHELELAVTVELVAKEVSEEHRPRVGTDDRLRQGGLVHLEEPKLRVLG